MKYFSLEELLRSDTAIRLKINNTASEEIKNNLRALVLNILDPLREKYGEPIMVSSGYRCEKLNKVVGGVSSSQHLKGEAADIYCRDNKRLWSIISNSNMQYDQLINEHNLSWIHVSYSRHRPNRRQILTIT